MSEKEFDHTSPFDRFVLAILFGPLANERTQQLTGADMKAVYDWFATESQNLPPRAKIADELPL